MHTYQITLEVTVDEIAALKQAILTYAKSKEVTLENFDLIRDLYGKIEPAWNSRKGTK
jgi:hypothetical protein